MTVVGACLARPSERDEMVGVPVYGAPDDITVQVNAVPRFRSKIVNGSGWRWWPRNLSASRPGWAGVAGYGGRGAGGVRECAARRRPRRGVLSLRVYRAVELVSGPGSPRTGVHGGDSWGIVLACCPCRRNYPWSLRARKIV